MALPGIKQKCYICSEEVTEAEYRRELTCSYVACPGRDHAYHEECITEYLRKWKLPVDRLIGYNCPAILDNGRPCTGRITSTHHRQPLNQKKKQKRVEAAAAAAAVPKPKQQPVAKTKEAKQPANGVAAATAAMRPAGEAVLRQAGVAIGSVKTVNAKAVSRVVAPGSAAAARLTGAAAAVNNNESMAPERVVRQRVIPGWSPGEKPKNMSTLEQQRAMVAMLRAQAKEEAGRGNKAKAAAPAAATNAGAAGRGAGPSGSGAAGPSQVAAAGGGKANAGQPVRRQLMADDGDASGSDDSDVHPYSRYLRDEASSESLEEPGAATQQQRDFQLAQEDFPAFPVAAGNTGAAGPSVAATPTKQQRATTPPTPAAAREPQPPAAGDATPSPDGAGAAVASPAGEEEEADPVIGHDPVFATEDGTVVVQNEYGEYVRLEERYGTAPELIGVDDQGVVSYYVVVRRSVFEAQQAAAAAAAAAAAYGQDAAAAGALASAGGSGGVDPALTTAPSVDYALAAQAVAAVAPALAVPTPTAAAPSTPDLQAYGNGYGYAYNGVPLTEQGSGGHQAALAPTQSLQQQPHQPQPALQGVAASEEEGDLGDLLALCMGGGDGGAAAAAPAAPAPEPMGLAGQLLYAADPYAYQAAAPQQPQLMLQPQPQYPPHQQQDYFAHMAAGYPGMGMGYDAASAMGVPAMAPPMGGVHVPQPYGAVQAMPQPEGEDLDDLMQLLCV